MWRSNCNSRMISVEGVTVELVHALRLTFESLINLKYSFLEVDSSDFDLMNMWKKS